MATIQMRQTKKLKKELSNGEPMTSWEIKNNVSNKTRTRNPTVTSRLSISINPDIETDNKPSNFENFYLNQSEYKFIEDEEIASKEAINTYFSNIDKFEKINRA